MRAKIVRLLLRIINKFYNAWIKIFIVPYWKGFFKKIADTVVLSYTVHVGNLPIRKKGRFIDEEIANHEHILASMNTKKSYLGGECL